MAGGLWKVVPQTLPACQNKICSARDPHIPERYIEGQQGQIETIITEWGKKGTQKMKKERERKREKETDKNKESERHNRVESKT